MTPFIGVMAHLVRNDWDHQATIKLPQWLAFNHPLIGNNARSGDARFDDDRACTGQSPVYINNVLIDHDCSL
jgi:hypothetical protein